MRTKTCTQCSIAKALFEFGKSRSNPDGLQYWCRTCFAIYHRDHALGIRRTPPPPPHGMKQCTRCKVLKRVSEFSKGAREADGLQDNCRSCNKVVSAAHRAANPEKERERHAAYHRANREKVAFKTLAWQRTNPAKRKASSRRFYANNKEKELARRARWAANNQEWIRTYGAQWRIANPDKCRTHDRAYIQRLIQATPRWANHRKIDSFYAQAARLTKAKVTMHHVDHIVPLQSKIVCGLHCEDNLQVLTERENLKKKNRFTVA